MNAFFQINKNILYYISNKPMLLIIKNNKTKNNTINGFIIKK